MRATRDDVDGGVGQRTVDVIDEARRQWIAHGWSEAADGMDAVVGLFRAHQIMLARLENKLQPLGVSFARFEILRLLAFSQRGSMPITRLSRLLQVHATSVTSGVLRLESQGLVIRTRKADDRRRVHAVLTTRGRELVDLATRELNADVFNVLGISSREMTTLWTTLRALRANAGDFVPARDGRDRR